MRNNPQKKPRILLFDVETSLSVVASFTLYPYAIAPNAILKDRKIICAAWKWLDEKKIYSVSVLDGGKVDDDKNVVRKLHDVLKGADATITHNGIQFDHRILNSRIIYHKLAPLPDMVKIDTLRIAKQHFNFLTKRLDYLGKYLGVGQKIKTDFDLWMRCLDGDVEAINKMVKYNKQDVNLLEKVYHHLAPFADAKLNRNLIGFNNGKEGCPSCGSANIKVNGVRYNKVTAIRRYQCRDCGHNFKGREIVSRAKLR